MPWSLLKDFGTVSRGGLCSAVCDYCQNMNTVIDLRSPDPPVKIKVSVFNQLRQCGQGGGGALTGLPPFLYLYKETISGVGELGTDSWYLERIG